ncbi:MAG: biosynthetic arginine decarboxylase [Thermoguttaceae bacterium]|jgi:arginine decarboxylase
MNEQETRRWTVADSAELYEVPGWGKGYFSVNAAGHVCIHPNKDAQRLIDLKQLVDQLQVRGIDLPILIRFGDVLKHRLGEIHAAFQAAINEHQYKGSYQCVYPIKVNQQRQVVEEVLKFGRTHRYGLEAGSKPELLAVVAIASNDAPIICNGFKDDEFVETALLAQKIGRQVFVVVEKYTDLELILHHAEQIGVRPLIGVRVKLASLGSGRWQASGGYRSKFGLSVSEILRLLAELQGRGMADCFKLLHFHIGSQVTNIRHVKAALNEVARVYVDLARHGAGLEYLDVGGGLGVDYDGSQTNFESSVNYTLQEYANDVVYHVQSVCDDAAVPHPNILSESGRAIVAYHSVLVFNILGTADRGENNLPAELPDNAEQPLWDLLETYKDLTVRNVLESYHDAQQALDMTMHLFGGGYMPLDQRCQAENLFWAICRKIQRLARQAEDVPEELQGLDALLSETYFCNFSLFQSIPDSWAVKQLFPIMPIHRLDERPTQHAVLGDITCDSDGKVERFIDRRDVKRTLLLHPPGGRPYYLGAFLVGAYQETLGDLHNLFGDTNAVHVSTDGNCNLVVEAVINGDTVREVLRYMQFDPDVLVDRMRTAVEQAVRSNSIDEQQAGRIMRAYRAGLDGYTYLEERGD